MAAVVGNEGSKDAVRSCGMKKGGSLRTSLTSSPSLVPLDVCDLSSGIMTQTRVLPGRGERVTRDFGYPTQAVPLGSLLVSRAMLVPSWSSLLPLIWTLGYWMFIICGRRGFCAVIFEPLVWSVSSRIWWLGLALSLTNCVLVTQPL